MSFPSNSSRFSAFSLLALPLALASVAGCSKEAPAAAPAGPPPALPVHTVAVAPVDAPEIIEVVGQAEGAREVEVRARVQGILEKRTFDEGQTVKAGAVLFQIERAPYEVALKQAQAQLAQAKASGEAARAQLERAQSDLAQAKRDDARLQGLLKDKAVSQREADVAQAGAQAAQAGIESAKAAQAGADAAQLAAQAQIDAAELNLSYCSVTAPVDGVTGRAVKSEGALVSPADGLLTTLAQTDPIWVRFSFSNAELARVQGDPAKAIEKVSALLPSGAEYPQPGKINFTASAVDPNLDTLSLRAEFPNKERAILPGQFLRVKAQVGIKKGVFLLPQEAVLTHPQFGTTVFVMAPGEGGAMVAQPRPVKAGAWQGDRWIIEPGEGTALKAGDQVIVDQLSKIGFMMMKTGGKPVGVVDAAKMAQAGARVSPPAGESAGKPSSPREPKSPVAGAGEDARAPGSKEGAAK